MGNKRLADLHAVGTQPPLTSQRLIDRFDTEGIVGKVGGSKNPSPQARVPKRLVLDLVETFVLAALPSVGLRRDCMVVSGLVCGPACGTGSPLPDCPADSGQAHEANDHNRDPR